MAEGKTNAMRLLDQHSIEYEMHHYDNKDGKIDGLAVAGKIGRPANEVYKTLVAHSLNELYVFVIPVDAELDLKKAAKAAGTKKVEMLPVKELQKRTGYIRGGCSPIGMKKLYPTFVADAAEQLERIIVSAGKIGTQIELHPQDLLKAVSARFADLLKDQPLS